MRGFFATAAILVLLLTAWQMLRQGDLSEPAFRQVLFNTVSILTGRAMPMPTICSGGRFPVAMLFFVGLIGGCAGSTSCSIKIFRYQLLFASVRAQLQRIYTPHGIFTPRYGGRAIGDDVLNSVMSFFVFFIVTLGLMSVMLGVTGLDFTTSVSGAAAALANIGPGLGETIGPAGNFSTLNDLAKWVLSAGMLIGRLELFAVYAIFTIGFLESLMSKRPLGAQISHMLKSRGVDVIFGIPGVHNQEMYRGIEEAGFTARAGPA